MKKTYEIAGEVMGFFESFKGSRPAIDNERILIVRGKSRKVLPLDDFDSKLSEIGEILGGTEIESTSDKIEDILKLGAIKTSKKVKLVLEMLTVKDSLGWKKNWNQWDL